MDGLDWVGEGMGMGDGGWGWGGGGVGVVCLWLVGPSIQVCSGEQFTSLSLCFGCGVSVGSCKV